MRIILNRAFLRDSTVVMPWLRMLTFLLALLLLLSSSGFASSPKEIKRVLVLYSLDKGHPAHELTDKGIREAFESNKLFQVQIYREYLDTSRFPEPRYASSMADYLGGKYSGLKLDAIIAVYPQAVDFLLANKRTPFQNVPLITCEITQSFGNMLEHSPARRFITGHIMGSNVTGLLDTALRMRPSTKQVALISGTTLNDRYGEKIIREVLNKYGARFTVIDLTRLPMEEILRRVGSLPPDTVVFYSSVMRDGAGQIFVPREALTLIAKTASTPVFGLYDSFLGFGIVGGPLISLELAGKTAAGLALRVLMGERPEYIPFVQDSGYTSMFDWRELKRWGIPESSLPPESIIVNREFSVWDSYKWYITGVVVFCLVESFLVILLVFSLRKRRKALNDLAEAEMRYRTVADYTYDWEYWSAPDGKILYVSPSCERVTGYTSQQFIEEPSLLSDIIIPEDRPAWDVHRHDAGVELKLQEIQFRIRAHDGKIRWIDHSCRSVIDEHGHFQGFRVSNRDVTERKMTELKARQQQNELAHVTRVAVLGELTSSLAHELNQPLAAILNYANAAQRFLASDKPDLSRVREALIGIAQDDKRASDVILKVRDLLKKEEPQFNLLEVNGVVKETLELIRGESVMKGSSLATDFAPGLAIAMADRVQLQQVIINLVINAVAAMGDIEPGARSIVVKTEKFEDKDVIVSVSDCGPGIDEAFKELIFEPFYTTKPTGMGMGLAISQRIINAFGGSIWAENNPHQGATVCFSIPMAATGIGDIQRAIEDGQVN